MVYKGIQYATDLLLPTVNLPVEITEVVSAAGRAENETVRTLCIGHGAVFATNVTVAFVRILPCMV